MISYSFLCKKCGEFTEQHNSTKGEKTYAFCPQCEQRAERVYRAPNTLTMNKTLKDKLNQGPEPKRMMKEDIKGAKMNRQKPTHADRPWQLG